MLTCKELTEVITDYLEGRLTLGRRLSFRLHVMICRPCRAYLRQMRLTIGALGAPPAEPVPPEVLEEMLRRFRHWQR